MEGDCVTPETTCFLSVEQPDPRRAPWRHVTLDQTAPAALGNKRSPCCQLLVGQSFQSRVSRRPCPAPLPRVAHPVWGLPCQPHCSEGAARQPPRPAHLLPTRGTHSKCSSVDTICCFSNATYFSKQVILSMIMSLTKRKVLDGMQPCLFWKRAALSGPGTGTGPRTRNHDHARSHEWREARGEWKRTDMFSFYRRS